MTIKRVLCPERVRRIPAQFSWVDHRLIRAQYLGRCDLASAALYLFLVTVADAKGLSYYSDGALVQHLPLNDGRLHQARLDLIRIGLIAYQRPIYQVLALDSPPRVQAPELTAQEVSAKIGQLRAALRGTP